MTRRVVAVVPDLFFAVKIASTARALGITLDLVPLAKAHDACLESTTDLVVLDLHAPGALDDVIRTLKADPRTAGVPVCGFFSHVEVARRNDAQAAGIDAALPRSRFTERLANLLAHGPTA